MAKPRKALQLLAARQHDPFQGGTACKGIDMGYFWQQAQVQIFEDFESP